MHKLRSFVHISAATLAMLSACSVGPDFVRPAPPNVNRYTLEPLIEETATADGLAQNFKMGAAIPFYWWRLFNSTQLNAIVDQAITHNPTLQASESRLRQSQDILRAGYGVFYPQVNMGLNAYRVRSAPIQQGSSMPSSIFNVVTLNGSMSYALNVFGGEDRSVEGLQAHSDYQRYLSKAAYLSLTANVVNTSIARAAYIAQIRATEQLTALENQQLRTTEVQFLTGTATYANVLSIRSLIAINQASLALLKQKVSQTEHLLATLEGLEPSSIKLPDIEFTDINLPLELPVSLPSSLVRLRPDILAAEAQLHVASANIGVATAAMFPNFSLNAAYGITGSSLGNLGGAAGRFWSMGPLASIPLFSGGSLKYAHQAALDAYQESQANYRQTVLSAFAQVADTLNALEHDAEALQAQAEALRTSGEVINLLKVNYRAGLVTYVDVLVADVQLHQATIAYLQAVAQRYQDTVGLFVALGGGWWNGQHSTDEGSLP